MTIRILSLHFYPDSSSTGNLLSDLALGLVKNGFNVEVFTSQPLDNIKNVCPKYEEYNKIKIFRLSNLRINKHKKIGKVFNFLNYFFKTFFKVIFSSHNENILYLIVSNPPFLPIIGAMMSYLRNIHFIHILHDIQPEESINTNYVSSKSLYVKIWKFLNKYIYKKSSHIIVLSDGMKKTVENKLDKIYKGKKHKEKISIIHNWADGEYLKPISFSDNVFIKQHNLENKFIINYSGNLGVYQKFDSILEVTKRLKNENIVFLFIGDGVKKNSMIKFKEDFGLNNVLFFPYLDKKILPHALTASHLSIVHLEREIEGLAMPSKFYSILATGTPVLAFTRDGSDLQKIVIDANCGCVVSHDDIDGIVDKIYKVKNVRNLQEELGKNSRKYFENNFTSKHAVVKYIDVINSVSGEYESTV